MNVIVDSSVWIEYFRGSDPQGRLDFLIEENLVAVNDVILAELLPVLHVRRENKLIGLLRHVTNFSISVDWDEVVQIQVICIRNGINSVGLSDIIIAQNAVQNHVMLYSNDKHFRLLADKIGLALYGGV